MRVAVAAASLLAVATPASAEQAHILVEGGTVIRTYSNPVTRSSTPDLGVMGSWRVGVGYRQLYLAAEGEVGGSVSTDGVAARDLGTQVLGEAPHHAHLTIAQGVLIAGAQAEHGRSIYGVELAAGGREVRYAFATQEDHGEDLPWIRGTSRVVEARARVGYWVTPWVSAGVSIGASLLDQTWMGGLHLSVRTDRYQR